MKRGVSGYKLSNIILLESQFKRSIDLEINRIDFDNRVNVNIEKEIKENVLYLITTLSLSSGKENTSQLDAVIKMLGVFSVLDEPTIAIEDFAKKNGPAIMYPFIREHLANLSMKAGLSPILLPPINFEKFDSGKE